MGYPYIFHKMFKSVSQNHSEVCITGWNTETHFWQATFARGWPSHSANQKYFFTCFEKS